MALFKNGDYPGAYSMRAPKKAIIADLLKKFNLNGGTLHYDYIVDPSHGHETMQMMRGIVQNMIEEELILPPAPDSSLLMLTPKGKLAIPQKNGKDYNRETRNILFGKTRKFILYALTLIAVAVIMYFIFNKINQYTPH